MEDRGSVWGSGTGQVLPLAPLGSLAMLSTGRLVVNKYVCMPALNMTDAGVFVKASLYSRCLLRSLYQMDMWNKPHGFWKHSLWCAGLALMIRVKRKWIFEFSIQKFVFNPSGFMLMCHTVCRKQNLLLFSVTSLKIKNLKEVWLTVLKRTLFHTNFIFWTEEPRAPLSLGLQ